MPEEVELKSADFHYSSSYSDSKPAHLVFNEVFSSKSRLLPPDSCAAVEEFFGKVSEAKTNPVVLDHKKRSGGYR